eukprot:scaffold4166_cov95-Cylindrotheca_fusiformis.AAC.8
MIRAEQSNRTQPSCELTLVVCPSLGKVEANELLQISYVTWNTSRKGVDANAKVFALPQISNFTWNGNRNVLRSRSRRAMLLFPPNQAAV